MPTNALLVGGVGDLTRRIVDSDTIKLITTTNAHPAAILHNGADMSAMIGYDVHTYTRTNKCEYSDEWLYEFWHSYSVA